MPNVGPMEIILVLIVALIVFGPKKLPELGKSLGKGINEFKGSISGDHESSEPAAVESAPVKVAPVAVTAEPVVVEPATKFRVGEKQA
jgi:sec-independent protein translocase protein TatA